MREAYEHVNASLADNYRPSGHRVSFSRRLKEYGLFLSLFFAPARRAVHLLYEMDGAHNLFTETTLYHNLGYWADEPATLDEACRALARLVGEAAGLGPSDHVLDVGFGFGDQDILWAEEFGVEQIVGLNVVPRQVEVARERVARSKADGRVELLVGSATDTGFDDASFDKVLALESAFHFATREKFFREAYRVLRPGGRIVLAEPSLRPGKKQDAVSTYLQCSIVATPKENIYDRDTYARKLIGAGFNPVSIKSIAEQVYPPFMRYLARRVEEPEITGRVNPLIRGMWKGWVESFQRGEGGARETHDYIVAVGEKPHAPAV